jgi:hypothetical protein
MAKLLRGIATIAGGVTQVELDALDTGLAENLTTYTTDLTVASGNSTVVAGAVTIPNLTVNGNLAVTTSLNVTTDLAIGASGTLNIIG